MPYHACLFVWFIYIHWHFSTNSVHFYNQWNFYTYTVYLYIHWSFLHTIKFLCIYSSPYTVFPYKHWNFYAYPDTSIYLHCTTLRTLKYIYRPSPLSNPHCLSLQSLNTLKQPPYSDIPPSLPYFPTRPETFPIPYHPSNAPVLPLTPGNTQPKATHLVIHQIRGIFCHRPHEGTGRIAVAVFVQGLLVFLEGDAVLPSVDAFVAPLAQTASWGEGERRRKRGWLE